MEGLIVTDRNMENTSQVLFPNISSGNKEINITICSLSSILSFERKKEYKNKNSLKGC